MSNERVCTPPAGIGNSAGCTIVGESGATYTEPPPSTTSVTTFIADQQPDHRLIAMPCRPKSSNSCALLG